MTGERESESEREREREGVHDPKEEVEDRKFSLAGKC